MPYSKFMIIDPIVFIAKVPSRNPQAVITEMASALASTAVEMCGRDGSYVIMFQGGFATLCAVGETLFIEVEASDMVICHGIKATIGGLLVGTINELPPELLWVPKKHFSN